MNALDDPGAVSRFLRLLISRGVHKGPIRGTLTICIRERPECTLVFTKYLGTDGKPGFAAELRREDWFEVHYDAFRTELRRRGVPHTEITNPRPLLKFDCGQNYGQGLVLTQILFEDVLKAPLATDCVAYWRHVVIDNKPEWTGVDDPDTNWL